MSFHLLVSKILVFKEGNCHHHSSLNQVAEYGILPEGRLKKTQQLRLVLEQSLANRWREDYYHQ